MCGSTKGDQADRYSRCGSPGEECQPRVLDGRGLATAVTWGFSKASPRDVGVRWSPGCGAEGVSPPTIACAA